jgi:hypothetical protein
LAREIEPSTISAVAQESALSDAALGLIKSLSNPLAVEAFSDDELKNYEEVVYSRVRWAGHCANTFLDLCDWIELRIAFPHQVLVH